MKNLFGPIILLGLLTVPILLIAACGSATANGPNQVHMNDTSFEQSSITIKKGALITLVNDTAATHIIENGTWDNNGNARAAKEPRAPTVDAQMNSNATQEFGPFNASGTFHLYCTIHPDMKLTVIVKP